MYVYNYVDMLIIKIIILNIHKFTFQFIKYTRTYLSHLLNTHDDQSIILDTK